MTLHKVAPGDDFAFPAEAFNAIVDLKAAADRRRLDRGGGAIAQPSPRGIVVRVKNETGSDRARFSVLGIYAPLWTPTENETDFLSGQTPLRGVTPAAGGPFVVLLEPIAAGEIGRAMILGVTAVKLDVQAESHVWADLIPSDCSMLRTGPSGAARVLWKESGTSTNLWGLVQFPAAVGSGGRAKWIEFELAADLGGTYAIADIIDFHDGTDPDPTPNPEAHAAILTTRTDDDTGVVTFAVYGILTTRTDANTGVVTAAGHGLAEGDYADIFWSGGARDHMSVTAVSGNAVSVDGGTGDDLPAEDTAVLITESFVGPPPENGYDHGLVVGDYADVFWVYAAVCYYRKRMKVTAVSGNQVALDQEAGVTYGTALPAADSDVTAIRSFTVWNTRGMYSGLHGTSRSARGTARLSPAKPAYVTPGPPRPDVPEQKEDRYYIDSMECETPNS